MSKVCAKCRYFHNHHTIAAALCKHEKSAVGLVYGNLSSCTNMRYTTNKSLCGTEGVFFEPKVIEPPKKSFFTKVKEMLT